MGHPRAPLALAPGPNSVHYAALPSYLGDEVSSLNQAAYPVDLA
jgi:hypothetical protein